jgi:hypothetical protein
MTTESTRTSHGSWDYLLAMVTVGLLGALGAQSLAGTIYAWWAYRTIPGWEQSGYGSFISAMNAVAAPLVVALIVVMGLCVPKRLLGHRTLVGVSAAMVIAGLAAWTASGSLATGLALYLVLAALIQVAVVVLTVVNGGGLAYLSESRAAKIGSGLLHLGFILFALVVVALQRSAAMLPVFAISAVLLTGGSAIAFYARTTSRAPVTDDPAAGD